MNISEKLTTIAENIPKVYQAGKDAEWNKFWDNLQRNGAARSYAYSFLEWDESAFYPKYDIIIGKGDGADAGSTATSTFRKFHSLKVSDKETKTPIDLTQRLEDCGVTLNTTLCDSFTYTFSFANISRIPEIDTRGSTSIGYMAFYHAINLETIDKIILKDDGSQSCNSNNFEGCYALKNIRFEGIIGTSMNFQWSKLLTKESMTSIINALSDTISATLTLSQTAVNNAFTTDEWNSLKSTKSNWEIKLV